MKTKIKKWLSILMIIITMFSTFGNIVYALEIDTADLKNSGRCEEHLQYWNGSSWSYITTTYVTYTEGGVQYPAFCINRELPRSW